MMLRNEMNIASMRPYGSGCSRYELNDGPAGVGLVVANTGADLSKEELSLIPGYKARKLWPP